MPFASERAIPPVAPSQMICRAPERSSTSQKAASSDAVSAVTPRMRKSWRARTSCLPSAAPDWPDASCDTPTPFAIATATTERSCSTKSTANGTSR
eukprot:6800857-Prymnesium_polylepis.1